ncbi:MAG: hypothetical protein AAF618_13835, partial [Pseudomonadota bacterium]
MRCLIALLIALLPSLGLAQSLIDETRLPEPWIELSADFTGDGGAEILRAMPFDLDHDIIALTVSEEGRFSAPRLFAIGVNRTGEAGLEITSPSSFLIRTGCFACGRMHSEFLHKIAYRDGAFVVAGYTETIIDRIFAVRITCDVNHLTGRAEVRLDGEVVADGPAEKRYPLDDWSAERPASCA